ncbi:hypothetical protein RESH_04763 [Rhodopirellula europaea SH398]|uniref:Uncharacterized protein n=1 Tax=Rhodopirellula europaea SH398 TaxID=1263868 RepID=M5SEQ9_9BACT|nr:hypothetical protein RESH_04763 [Rhodopirellula europaea SH398]
MTDKRIECEPIPTGCQSTTETSRSAITDHRSNEVSVNERAATHVQRWRDYRTTWKIKSAKIGAQDAPDGQIDSRKMASHDANTNSHRRRKATSIEHGPHWSKQRPNWDREDPNRSRERHLRKCSSCNCNRLRMGRSRHVWDRDPTWTLVQMIHRDGSNCRLLQHHFHCMLLPFDTRSNAEGTSIN